jgi:hypothetical protein
MRFNITTDNAKFFVDKEKKTVVCVIENTKKLFCDFVNTNFRISTDCDEIYNCVHGINGCDSILDEKMLMPNKFVGIAKCSENDEWNEDIGCTIAFSRAKNNLINSFFKRAQTYVNYIDKWLNEAVNTFNMLGEKLEVNKTKRNEYIASLIAE